MNTVLTPEFSPIAKCAPSAAQETSAGLQRNGGLLQSNFRHVLQIERFGPRFSGGSLEFGYIDGRYWIVPRNYSYRLIDGLISTVRKGFVFDFASVPRIFWRLYPPAGMEGNPYGIAAMWHDWVYAHGRIGGACVRRAVADALFLEIMLCVGVSRAVAKIMYRSVRLFGGWSWNRNRRAEEDDA